ncbi:MAG: hypothetical protein Q9174_005847 [Haloplaca sp. 1 TL-2023]
MILVLVLPYDNDEKEWAHFRRSPTSKPNPDPRYVEILRVNRQLYEESTDILYRSNWHSMTGGHSSVLYNTRQLLWTSNGAYRASLPVHSLLPLVTKWQYAVAGFCGIYPHSGSNPQLIKLLLRKDEWKPFFEGIDFMADLLRGTSNCKELRLLFPGYCGIAIRDVESTVAFWLKVFQPVIRVNRRVKTTFTLYCYQHHGTFDTDRALQCQEAACLQIRDDLQKHKDALDSAMVYQPSRRWRSPMGGRPMRFAMSRIESPPI